MFVVVAGRPRAESGSPRFPSMNQKTVHGWGTTMVVIGEVRARCTPHYGCLRTRSTRRQPVLDSNFGVRRLEQVSKDPGEVRDVERAKSGSGVITVGAVIEPVVAVRNGM